MNPLEILKFWPSASVRLEDGKVVLNDPMNREQISTWVQAREREIKEALLKEEQAKRAKAL